MASVTQRIRSISQPYGGYIPRKNFLIKQLDDGKNLHPKENINPSLVGMAVDYLTRFLMGTPREKAFTISLIGATFYDLSTRSTSGLSHARHLLEEIEGLDEKSVKAACQLVGYDVCFRAGISGYKPVDEIQPDSNTIENIITMVNRNLSFWKEYGPIIKDGFTFEGGYTETINTGDGDFLTEDTLWDLKVLKKEPTSQNTLELLIYYLMGIHSIHPEFKKIQKLGIYNPRLNKVYTIKIDEISDEVIEEVSTKVIGYS